MRRQGREIRGFPRSKHTGRVVHVLLLRWYGIGLSVVGEVEKFRAVCFSATEFGIVCFLSSSLLSCIYKVPDYFLSSPSGLPAPPATIFTTATTTTVTTITCHHWKASLPSPPASHAH